MKLTKRPRKPNTGARGYTRIEKKFVPYRRRQGDPTLVNPPRDPMDDGEYQKPKDIKQIDPDQSKHPWAEMIRTGRNYGKYKTPLIMRRVEDGMVIGNIRVRKVERVDSKWGTVHAPQLKDARGNIIDVEVPKFTKYEHQTGRVECTCLLCKKQFETSIEKLHPNNLKTTLWSCGCSKRVPVYTKPRSGGRKPIGLEVGMEIARLTILGWVPKQGWLCKCLCGATVCVEARKLRVQSVRGCQKCDPVGWSKSRGPRKELTEIDGKPVGAYDVKDANGRIVGSTLLWWQKYE